MHPATIAAVVVTLALTQGRCSANARVTASTPADTSGTTTTLDGKLTVPTGFHVSYFARGVDGVRFMALGPDGAVYASEPSSNRVMRIQDVNGDGVADSIVPAVTGLNRPHGLALHGGWLYIANTDGVVRVHLGADGRAAGTPQVLTQNSSGAGHWTRTVVFGADSMMYVSIGSSCNLCVERDSDRATVMRYDADGQHGEVFASGLRNAVGMAVNPVTNAMWVSQNERDNLPPNHQNLPPEEINILQEHGNYGWPFCYSHGGAPVPNPEYADSTAYCAHTITAALEMQAHSAPLGITFLDRATNFPASYRGDLLVAFHGSWDRDVPTGAKVVRVHIVNDRPVSYEDFVSGWQLASGQRWGRPVDVMVYTDGSVLVSDDLGNAIFRIYQ